MSWVRGRWRTRECSSPSEATAGGGRWGAVPVLLYGAGGYRKIYVQMNAQSARNQSEVLAVRVSGHRSTRAGTYEYGSVDRRVRVSGPRSTGVDTYEYGSCMRTYSTGTGTCEGDGIRLLYTDAACNCQYRPTCRACVRQMERACVVTSALCDPTEPNANCRACPSRSTMLKVRHPQALCPSLVKI